VTRLLTPACIAAQRWFRSKHRAIASVREVERVPIHPGALSVVEVAYADGGSSDRYLLPVMGQREPVDGDGLWTALAKAIERGGRIGPFEARLRHAPDGIPPGERQLGVEQSNTSVVLGERLILKLYRLLEPGDNPDLEIGAFLADAGFTDTPALAGSLAYAPGDRAPAAAAMLQAFVPSRGDTWAAMLDALARDPQSGVALAAQVGHLTARLHAALASRPDVPGFPSRAASVAETASWCASAEQQLAQAVGSLSGEPHDRLVALAPAVRERFADTFGSASGAAQVSRIHGDYHLGQVLVRVDGGLTVIDFEGEPARPLADRREPSSPLRDVAGMLRSLDYAARTAAPDPDAWLPSARSAFLDAYGRVTPSDAPLLDAFELEKGCYEVRYEAANRPAWLWLPLAAVERLARSA